jgi:hypothetical protein
MAITEVKGKIFTQIKFTGAGDTWSMANPAVIKSVRLTAPPTKLVDADYITFNEVIAGGVSPDLFVLSKEARATFFNGTRTFKLGISSYSLTNPADVVLSVEVE